MSSSASSREKMDVAGSIPAEAPRVSLAIASPPSALLVEFSASGCAPATLFGRPVMAVAIVMAVTVRVSVAFRRARGRRARDVAEHSAEAAGEPSADDVGFLAVAAAEDHRLPSALPRQALGALLRPSPR